MGIHQRGESNSIRDLLFKIARREQLEVFEGDTTPFSLYASAWLERLTIQVIPCIIHL